MAPPHPRTSRTPLQYRIFADVVDIRRDTPRPQDKFLVDTNAWYWLTYSKASLCSTGPRPHQINNYPPYMKAALTQRAGLFHSGLSLPELTSLIEGAELELFNAKNSSQLTKKEARYNEPMFRAKVAQEVSAAWAQIESMSILALTTIDTPTVKDALSRLTVTKLDGYDLFTAGTNTGSSKLLIITDDGDFASVPNAIVFTCNLAVLSAAQSQGKIVTR
jgi:hypothetical protein